MLEARDAQLADPCQPLQGLSAAGPASAPALKGPPFDQVPCEPMVWAMAQPAEYFLYFRQRTFYLRVYVRGREGMCTCVSASERHVCVLLNSIIKLLNPHEILQPGCVIKLNLLQSSKLPGKRGSGTRSPPLKVVKVLGPEKKWAGLGRTSPPCSQVSEPVSQCGVDGSGGRQNPDRSGCAVISRLIQN